MKTLVVMPVSTYKVLRFMCEVGSPEYLLLKTRFIVCDGTEDVYLFCNNVDAQSLLEFASRRCPRLVSQIRLTIAVASAFSGDRDFRRGQRAARAWLRIMRRFVMACVQQVASMVWRRQKMPLRNAYLTFFTEHFIKR